MYMDVHTGDKLLYVYTDMLLGDICIHKIEKMDIDIFTL